MKKANTYHTNIPNINTSDGDKLIFPFSPPIFQTELNDNLIKELLDEGRKLDMKNDYSPKLAGKLKSGRSYIYEDDFILKFEPKLLQLATDYFNGLYEIYGENYKGVNSILRVQKERGEITPGKLRLDTLWVNFQHKGDHNPPHTHTGQLSFVIYLQVDKKIFTVDADSNSRDAGRIIFQYGEQMTHLMGNDYPVNPYTGLMFMFPARLKHFVPPFWIDSERISVSGNLIVI